MIDNRGLISRLFGHSMAKISVMGDGSEFRKLGTAT
jgi:hypothetical protein